MTRLHRTVDNEGNRLEVQREGSRLQLYINDVLHSEHDPTQRVTGDMWDPLALAGLLAPTGSIHDVLILGLGGGACAHMVHDIIAPQGDIVAVDSCPTIARIATEFFHAPCVPRIDDAQNAVRHFLTAGHRFDLIIDDVFSRDDDDAKRAYPFDAAWRDELSRLLSPGRGVLIANIPAPKDLPEALVALPDDVQSLYVFRVDGSQNRIIAFSRHRTPRKVFFARVADRLPKSSRRCLRWTVTEKRLPRLPR